MSYEASIIINCESYSSRIKDFILIMNDIKWGIYNDNEYVSYLPKGDDGLFDWKADKSSVEQILVSVKYNVSIQLISEMI